MKKTVKKTVVTSLEQNWHRIDFLWRISETTPADTETTTESDKRKRRVNAWKGRSSTAAPHTGGLSNYVSSLAASPHNRNFLASPAAVRANPTSSASLLAKLFNSNSLSNLFSWFFSRPKLDGSVGLRLFSFPVASLCLWEVWDLYSLMFEATLRGNARKWSCWWLTIFHRYFKCKKSIHSIRKYFK